MMLRAMMFMLSVAVILLPERAEACGGPDRCLVAEGYYLAAPPPDWDGESPLPLVVYFHGWNSSPEGTFRNRVMVNSVHKRGALFVAPFAPNGYWRQIGQGRAEAGRDEAAFIRTVMTDLARRWPIDREKTLASGFSRGASMVWNVACYTGDLFQAYAPIAGGFWGSTPDDCPTGPVNLRHIHGMADRIVAYDTVGVYNSMPIPDGLAVFRRLSGADSVRSARSEMGRLTCETWTGSTGHVTQICLHPKGHSIPAEWVAEGFDWMAGL